MFLIPAGMLMGARVSTAEWWLWNQVPVTLGNVVGGMIFTGLALYATHGCTEATPRSRGVREQAAGTEGGRRPGGTEGMRRGGFS